MFNFNSKLNAHTMLISFSKNIFFFLILLLSLILVLLSLPMDRAFQGILDYVGAYYILFSSLALAFGLVTFCIQMKEKIFVYRFVQAKDDFKIDGADFKVVKRTKKGLILKSDTLKDHIFLPFNYSTARLKLILTAIGKHSDYLELPGVESRSAKVRQARMKVQKNIDLITPPKQD